MISIIKKRIETMESKTGMKRKRARNIFLNVCVNYIKPLTDIPGIEGELAVTLHEAGYSQADDLLLKFIQLSDKPGMFVNWLKTLGANLQQVCLCYTALSDWYLEFMSNKLLQHEH